MRKIGFLFLGLVLTINLILSVQAAGNVLVKDQFSGINSYGITSGNGQIVDYDNELIVKGVGKNGKAVGLYSSHVEYEARNENLKSGSFEIWFRTKDSSSFGLLDLEGTKGNDYQYGIFVNYGQVFFEGGSYGKDQMRSSKQIKFNKWNHLVVTWDAKKDSANIYLNGVKTSARFVDLAKVGPTQKIYVGDHWWYGESSNLVVDRVSVWNKDIGQVRAQELYQSFNKK